MMESYPIYLFGIIGLIIASLISYVISGASANNMLDNFKSLGTLTGKSQHEILGVVGKPIHISTMDDGSYLYQWMSDSQSLGGSNYHISLIFKDGLCTQIASESMFNP